MQRNEIVHATERVAYGWTETRAAWPTATPSYWRAIWMAVSACCGLRGPGEDCCLPSPDPQVK